MEYLAQGILPTDRTLAHKLSNSLLDISCIMESYSNNASEYEAYLTGLAIALSIWVKHMKVLGDSNLVVS